MKDEAVEFLSDLVPEIRRPTEIATASSLDSWIGTSQDRGLTEIFHEVREKHDVTDAMLLVDGAP